MTFSKNRRPAGLGIRPSGWLAVALLSVLLSISPSTHAGAGEPVPVLSLQTDLGVIEVELVHAAAPDLVDLLIERIRGPLFAPGVVPAETGADIGYYDGLPFDLARPHVEITTAARRPEQLFTVPPRIDARSLGLDQQKITDSVEAMSVLQQELLPAYTRSKKRGSITPRLHGWLEQWTAAQSANFLIGVSRLEINESLGYRYETGLASLPATVGAVALRPISPTVASSRLTILLTDIPERTGRWMVVGRVVSGLEVARAISARPLAPGPAAKGFQPLDPVVIERAWVDLRPTGSPE